MRPPDRIGTRLAAALLISAAAAAAGRAQGALELDERLAWEGDRHGTLGPTGRRLFAERLEVAPGLRGTFGYAARLRDALRDPLRVELRGADGALELALAAWTWHPSHVHALWEADGLLVEEWKLVTDDDALVERLRVTNASERARDVEVHLYGDATPMRERFRSQQTALDLAPVANVTPADVQLAPGAVEYDGVRFTVPAPGEEGRPTLLALAAADPGDPAAPFLERAELAVPDVAPAIATWHLLVAAGAQPGHGPGGSPAEFELELDDGSAERVPWPEGEPRVGIEEDARVEWRSLQLPGLPWPAYRLAYVPPPGRFVRLIRARKGADEGLALWIAGTVEVPPATGRLPLLLGRREPDGLPLHLVLAADGCAPAVTATGARSLMQRASLDPGESLVLDAVLQTGSRRLATALQAMERARTGEVLERHRAAYGAWFERNAPGFACSEPLFEQVWNYRWFLARQCMVRLERPQFSLPVFFESLHGERARVTVRATPFVLDEVRWLRDAELAQGQVRALVVRPERDGRIVGVGPGVRDALEVHAVAAAAVGAFEVNGSRQYVREVLPLLRRDLEATLAAGDGGGARTVEQAAYLYAAARALARGLRVTGEEGAEALERVADELRATARERAEGSAGAVSYALGLAADPPPGWQPVPEPAPGRGPALDPAAFSWAAHALARALREGAQPGVQSADLMQLLRSFARLHLEAGELARPVIHASHDAANGAGRGAPDCFASSFNDLLIRYVGGLVPRADGEIELWPLVHELEHFRFTGLPYHGRVLDISWDRPDGRRLHADFPEGYCLRVDGELVLELPELRRQRVR